MTDLVTTAAASETWTAAAGPPVRATLAGAESWTRGAPPVRVSKAGAEVWVSVALGTPPPPPTTRRRLFFLTS